jgi:hypothetical protein
VVRPAPGLGRQRHLTDTPDHQKARTTLRAFALSGARRGGRELAATGHRTAQFFVGDADGVRFASAPIAFKVQQALEGIPSI